MLTVDKLSLLDFEKIWPNFQKKTVFYPFQSFSYLKLFSDNFITEKNLNLLSITENEKPQSIGNHHLTDFGDIIIADKNKTEEIWQAIIRFFKNEGIKTVQLDYVRQDSPTLELFKSYCHHQSRHSVV